MLPKARIIGAGHFYLNDKLTSMDKVSQPQKNVPTLTECHTLRNVVSSVVEVEVGMVHINGKASIPIQIMLDEMGHPQGPISIKTDKNTAEGLLNGTMRKKVSK